jgi:hypothetical protein
MRAIFLSAIVLIGSLSQALAQRNPRLYEKRVPCLLNICEYTNLQTNKVEACLHFGPVVDSIKGSGEPLHCKCGPIWGRTYTRTYQC